MDRGDSVREERRARERDSCREACRKRQDPGWRQDTLQSGWVAAVVVVAAGLGFTFLLPHQATLEMRLWYSTNTRQMVTALAVYYPSHFLEWISLFNITLIHGIAVSHKAFSHSPTSKESMVFTTRQSSNNSGFILKA